MKSLLAILISVLFFLPTAKGQNGEIYGTVADEKGAPFQNVSISVFQSKKLLFSTLSEEDGSYSLKPMPVGCFKVEFKAEHYIRTIVLDLPFSSGSSSVKRNCKMIKVSSDSEMIIVHKMPIISKVDPVHIVDNNKTQSFHIYPWQNDHLILYEKDRLIIGGNRGDTTIYLIDGLLNETSDSTDSTRFNWLNANKLRKKTFIEKDFKYIPFQHFLETLPAFQR